MTSCRHAGSSGFLPPPALPLWIGIFLSVMISLTLCWRIMCLSLHSDCERLLKLSVTAKMVVPYWMWCLNYTKCTNCTAVSLIMLLWRLYYFYSLSFSFLQQSISQMQPWNSLTFHSHNSSVLLFFLSTGFKSQAGAWERETVRWNLLIVFFSSSFRAQTPQFGSFCYVLPCMGFCVQGKSQ